MATFWASLNDGKRDDAPPEEMDDDCPAAVDDIDSDWEDSGPPALTDSDTDGSEHEKEQLPAGKSTDDIECEFAVPLESKQSGRRKYTFTKRVRKGLVTVRRGTSTQAGKAASEAAKHGAAIGRCPRKCCSSVQSQHLDPVVLRMHHEFREKPAGARNTWLSNIMSNVNLDSPQPFTAHIDGQNDPLCSGCFRNGQNNLCWWR